jgi:hypothetical protein
MPEKPKEKAKDKKEKHDPEKSSWADDQKKREYYYDDAHGYEIYQPDEDELDEDKVY